MLESRYRGRRAAELLDCVSCLLTLPLYYSLNAGLGCYYYTTGERSARGGLARAVDWLLLGPTLLSLR
jgi:hypothetical protein